ncbi:MAG: hypothetical protein WC469_04700 [Candidatus Omnitrophota bacterium]
MDKQDLLNLKKRYLIWLYKTTKEAFDRYERKFTQFEVDEALLKEMEKELEDTYLPNEKEALDKFLNDYRKYAMEKEEACLKLKYEGKKINPEFIFLDIKLNAIESIIRKELGDKALKEIKKLYEEEMGRRIMTAAQEK